MENNDLYDGFTDKIANFEFQEEFFSAHEYSKLQFYHGSLQECLKDVSETKRPLLFYLHNKNKKFSQDFCNLISTERIEELIHDNYHIMGWNLNNTNLEAMQNKILIVDEIKDFIGRKEPCIFFIAPNQWSVKELEEERIRYAVDEFILVKSLKKIHEFLSRYVTRDYFKKMTSTKYQQRMYDELSDRDYDSFESDQHQLLKDKILFAFNGPPQQLTTGYIGYEEKAIKEADGIFDQIRRTNNESSKWNDRIVLSFIYNCTEPLEQEKQKKAKKNEDYEPEQDFCPLPVFVLRRCRGVEKPCRRIVDHNCRVYDTWDKYLEENKIPPRKMIYPKDGKYQNNNFNDVWLEQSLSPSSRGVRKFLHYTDISSGVVGFVAGAVCAASMFTPLAPIALTAALVGGGVTGGYAVGRSTQTLVDRKTHKLNIGIGDSESRAAYLNIAAGTVGTVGAGATSLMTTFVRNGGQVGKGILYTVNTINGANVIVSGAATVNSGIDVALQCWEDKQAPSPLTLVQLGSSLFFFGNSIYNFRTAATIVNETQASTINEINDSLRSNRHRKAFNKLLKETMRTRGDLKGKAEVISTMKQVGAARDDVIATLVRSNKNFNRDGIRFSAGDGGIKLNGVSVDIVDLGNLPKTQQGVFMEQLPAIPESYSLTNVKTTTNLINNVKINYDFISILGTVGVLDPSAIIRILDHFKQDTKEKIIQIYERFMNQLDIRFILDLQKLLTGNFQCQIIEYIVNFIRRKAQNVLEEFQQRILNESVTAVCRLFGFENPSVTLDFLIDTIVSKLLNRSDMMNALKKDFQSWCASLIYNAEKKRERKERRHNHEEKIRKICEICHGYYYVTKI